MTDINHILRRYELILTSAGEGIYGLDRDGKGTFVNPAAIELTGWTEEDIIGQPVHPQHHHTKTNGDFYPQHECPIYAALQDGEIHHINNEIFWHKDGSSFPVRYTSTPIWENGDIIGAVVVFQDISKIKQTENALNRLQHQNQLILASAGEGICGFDCKGNITFINPVAIKLLRWPDANIEGKRIHDMLDMDDADPSDCCPVTNIAQGKKSFEQNDQKFWRWDGTSFAVDFISTPIVEDDKLQGVVLVFRDITERKQAEQKLKNALSEIEQLKNRLQAENSYLQEQVNQKHNFENILGQSQSLNIILRQVEQVAPTETTVLIQGETGTGKELIARALHNLSQRQDRTLVKVNCAALPGNLIESELFGHEKGSFTGATSRRIGRFELADEGSIFLDEIGELPLELQAKLLRVLQEGEIERLGDSKTIKINVRVIAATHRDLKKMVQQGDFREDLFYRLSVFPLTIPPLRERKQDISLLAQNFANKYADKMSKQIQAISQSLLDNLQAYSWPGNVRELENVIERAVILSPDKTLLIPELLEAKNSQATNSGTMIPLSAMEKIHITKILEMTGWRIAGEKGAASILEMHPNTLRSRMDKLGIRRATTAN